MIKAVHLTRTRHAHQFIAAALYVLAPEAYDQHKDTTQDDNPVQFGGWCANMSAEQPQFQYWMNVFYLELTAMQLIGSMRGANFAKYQASLIQLTPWIFRLDYVTYARWPSVHVRDMHTLQERRPQVHREFYRLAFVTRETACSFS